MKILFSILLFIVSIEGYCWECNLPDIKKSCEFSTAIFYGNYIGTDTIPNFYDVYGDPFIIDNFEVIHFYQGIDTSIYNWKVQHSINKKYIISLINNCNEEDGICFQLNQLYLIYCFRDLYNGHLKTSGCSRTRQIINNNFKATIPFDPDFGKDEDLELKKIVRNNTTKNLISEHQSELKFKNDKLEIQLTEAKNKLSYISKLTQAFGSLFVLTLIVFGVYLIKHRK